MNSPSYKYGPGVSLQALSITCRGSRINLGMLTSHPSICFVACAESDVQILDEMDASMAEIAADEENDGASDGSASEAGFFDMGEDGDDVQLMREVLQKVSR